MKHKSWTVDCIRNEMNILSEKMGVPVDGIPIEISKRLKATKGSCSYRIANGILKTTKFRFADLLVNGTYPEPIVKEIIAHEYAHHYINTKMNKPQKHNKNFKNTCKLLNIPDNTYFEYSKDYEQPKYKYKVYCTNCDTVYLRNILKGGPDAYVKRFICGNCDGKLKVNELR